MLTLRDLKHFEFDKKLNDPLVKQVVFLEHQCWRNVQYSRRVCVEVSDIRSSIVHSDLEKTMCKVLQHITSIFVRRRSNRVIASTTKNDRTIVKSCRKKDCE